MEKLSISLEEDLAALARSRAAEAAGGNLSLLTAVALRRILDAPLLEVRRLADVERLDRRAPSRDAWMKAYWHILVHLMGRPEMDFMDNPYAPRQFDVFFAVLLLNHVGRNDDENDPFIPHIGPMPVVAGSPQPTQWIFDRSSSPVAAATTVASKLSEYGVVIPNAERG